jgi:hypothetical protein
MPPINLDRLFPYNGLGTLNLFGFGLMHSICQYLPRYFPVNLAVQGFYKYVSFGDYITLHNISTDAIVSRSLIFGITAFASVGYETSSFRMDFTSDVFGSEEPEIIKLRLNAGNSMRTSLGLSKNLFGVLNFFGNVTLADSPSFNFGTSVGMTF